MESFYFVLNKAMEAFQTEMNVLGLYVLAFIIIFWWTLIAGAFVWCLFHIILG